VTVNGFKISSSWDIRKEGPAEIGAKMLESLDALSAISPYFHPWWLADLAGEPTETVFPLEAMRSRMTEVVERGVMTDDSGYPTPIGGYAVSASNTEWSSPLSVGLRVHAGDSYGPLPGSGAVFGTAYNQVPDSAIIAYPVFKSVLKTLASIWNVAYAEAYSSDLSAHWNKPYSLRFDLSWMTYLSAPLAHQIVPPTDILIERIDDGGLLLIATEETFDVADSQHMAAARRIRDALAPLNAEAARQETNRFPPWPLGTPTRKP
jgi:hypothetical protein